MTVYNRVLANVWFLYSAKLLESPVSSLNHDIQHNMNRLVQFSFSDSLQRRLQ